MLNKKRGEKDMAKSNWDKMKERFDKNCPFTPEFIESSKEVRRCYEAGEFNTGDGGLTDEQRKDAKRRKDIFNEKIKKAGNRGVTEYDRLHLNGDKK